MVRASASSTVLMCDVGSTTVNQSTETAVAGPVVIDIDDAKLVSSDIFSYDDEPVILDVSPRVSIRRSTETYHASFGVYFIFYTVHIGV